jgi:Domain of Unknown Function with PDB structure (DUF3857)
MLYPRRWFALSIVTFLSPFSGISARAQQKALAPADFVAWLPVSDAERQLKAPAVEKGAGAEVLFYRVHVVDELLSGYDIQRVFYHYVRLKVFDEKGKEKAGTIDLTYGNRGGLLDVSGRTIKADGTILELDKKAVFKRDLVRAGGLSRKAVSFAMPGVEPGAILEYRWKESVEDDSIFQVRLKFQREFPIQKATYYFQPLPERITGSLHMALMSFNCQPSPVKQENDGYSSISVENLPASRNEAFSPSEANLEAWALLHYQSGDRKDPDKYWNEVSKKEYSELKDTLKSNNEIKAAAAEAVMGAKGDDEKIAAIIAVVRARVRNLYDDGVTDAERRAYLKSLPKERLRTASEIFKSGLGTANEMNVVFAAMAQQVGLEARPALVSDRTELLFHPKVTMDTFFLHNIDMAVKQGENWKVYDVSTKLLPAGMISWREEGVYALIADPKSANFITTPVSPAEASAEVRSAHLQLSSDGTLEGDVEESYTGHRGEEYRFALNGKSPAQREEWLRDRITKMFPDADVTELKIESVGDPTHPLRATYHLDAPHYAQVTGKRLLFQSSPFHRSIASPFSASERRFQVEFPYGWREFDEIHIQLPPEWALDNADSPGRVEFGTPGFFENHLTISRANELVSKREFVFGRGGTLNFEVSSYSALKKAFDVIQVLDQHSLSLKAAN